MSSVSSDLTELDSIFAEPDLLGIVQDLLGKREDRRLNRASTERLLLACRVAYLNDVDEEERVRAFFASRELSLRGIAPRWQFNDIDDDIPLDKLSKDKIERASIKRSRKLKQSDKIIFDLLWLSIAYPDHITSNDNWQDLFRSYGSWSKWFAVANKIIIRKATRHKKVKGLNLSSEQLIGCRYLCGDTQDKKFLNLERRLEAISRKIEKETSHLKRQQKQLNIKARSKYWLVGKITAWSPASGARVYKMMTGIVISKQAVGQNYSKVKHLS